MKKVNLFNLLAIAMVVALAFTSCKDNDDDPDPKPTDTTANVTNGGKYLFGDYTSDVTLKKDETYYVDGKASFKDGTTLTIEEGVEVVGLSAEISYILIEQGAKIEAIGTASNPIVMTADKEEAGSWGGLHICGKAKINAENGTGKSEIGDANYGGDNNADNSGTLKYVRLEYTGVALDPEHESNGLSLYGVGNGTTIEYVQVYAGADDGFEFFGGSVNVKYVVSSGSEDDSFDWTEGWSGKGQYMLAEQFPGKGDRGIEGDNNGDNNDATPFANPTLSQVTLIGGGAKGKYGMKLREGTKGNIMNLVVAGFTKRSIHVEHNQTLINVNNDELTVDYAYVDDNVSDQAIKYSVSKIDSTDANGDRVLDADGEVIEIDDPNAPELKADKKFEVEGAKVEITAVAEDASQTHTGGSDPSSIDAFFTSDSKIGSGNDWTADWTK